MVDTIAAMVVAAKISVHQPGAIPSSRCSDIALPREVKVAGLSVDGHRHRQQQQSQHDQRCAHAVANGLTDSRGSTSGRVA